MTMWIIMGVLIAGILSFLVIMTIRDKKKEKKNKVLAQEVSVRRDQSVTNVIVFLNEVIKHNNKLLKSFKPSIGKIKMSDIKNEIKKIMKFYKSTPEYNFVKDGSKEDAAKKSSKKIVMKIYENLDKESCSIWNKKLNENIEYITMKTKKIEKESLAKLTKESKELIKEYKIKGHQK